MSWNRLWVAGVVASLLLGGCAPKPHPKENSGTSAGKAPLVLIVSWDGAKASAVESLLKEGRLPTLKGLMGTGAWTLRARTIFPSLTLPSHTSMLTGVKPEGHGITWNRYEPERGTTRSRTLFEVVEGAGIPSALLCGKEKFRHVAKPGAPRFFLFSEESPEALVREAVGVLRKEAPGLLFLHLSAPDEAGHEFGWGNLASGQPPSQEFLAALEACDRATGLLVDELKREGWWGGTTLLLTADHGGHDKTHGSASEEDTLIPWVAAGGSVSARGELLEPVAIEDTAATALHELGVAIPSEWTGGAISLAPAPKHRRAA